MARVDEPRLTQAALYLRLSQEDRGADRSESIVNQQRLLRRYAEEHALSVAGEYIDDGYSGTSFDRPAFRRMIADIEAGRVQVVITKDLSRLGRNYTESGFYQEIFFPEHGVRYIALGEGYDSADELSTQAAPWMNVANEQYARDISRKIRASVTAKMADGLYISGFAPYGYRKDPADHNRLLIDEAAAPVVQRLFAMAMSGATPKVIAEALTAEGLPTPLAYRRLMRGEACEIGAWTPSTVSKILRNEVYTGCTVHGKTRKVNYKSDVHLRLPHEAWLIREHRHEPIIDRATFDAVQSALHRRRCAPNGGFCNIFAGVAFCADCGARMSTAPNHGNGQNLVCGRYKLYGAKACGNHFIAEGDLRALVLAALLRHLSRLSAEQWQACTAKPPPQAEAPRGTGSLEARIAELDTMIRRVYEDGLRGRISEERADKLTASFEEEQASLRRQLAAIQPPASVGDASPAPTAPTLPDALTREWLVASVERIEVRQGEWRGRRKRQTVEVRWRFRDGAQ